MMNAWILATLLGALRRAGGLAMPPVTSVQLVAFAGDQVNYDESAPHFRWCGHVGLRFQEMEGALFGFTPDTELVHDTHALITTLLEGNRFQGRVGDDLGEFEDAALSPYGQVFVFWNIPEDRCHEKDCGLSQVQSDVVSSVKFYAFPPEAPRKYRGSSYSACDASWGESCFNCATYPKSLGLPIPDDTGMLEVYLQKLAEEPGAVCRCYKSGKWLHSSKCKDSPSFAALEACSFEQPEPLDL
ncbi:unnamed protein product [Effrenium voratum]|uniref:Uncharacterized protein n=1 Tax=Effrenium voratum TaxID=2562239 RepID=A0AA36JRD9_9DINO|nr:unnamed protein product [Effrenium voratum]CAJ1417693.1 unnamed protein product [Effrenium voratum]